MIVAIERLLNSSSSERNDVDFLLEIIRSAGLQPDERGESLYGLDYKYMTSNGFIWQKPEELAAALIFLGKKRINSFLEIGTHRGGTFCIIASYLRACSKEFNRAVTVDKIDLFSIRHKMPFAFEFILGNSNEIKLEEKFDLVFIDGCHAKIQIESDYQKFGVNAKYCMFHDIDNMQLSEHHKLNGGSVKEFWNDLRGLKKEFIAEPRGTMGLGILCHKSIF